MKKYSQMLPTSPLNASKISQNPFKILPKCFPKPPNAPLRSITRPGTEDVTPCRLLFSTFWRHLFDFGHHFEPNWAPRDSQNPSCWHHVTLKNSKKVTQNDTSKRHNFFSRKLFEKRELLMGLNPPKLCV